MDDKYYTHCFLCEKEWGAGNLHAIHQVKFHGKFVCNVFLCVDCSERVMKEETTK